MGPTAPAEAGCWAQPGCRIAAAAAPRVSVDPAQTPALPLGRLSALKPQDFQPIWGPVCWDEFPTVPVSLPSRWPRGMWGQDRQIFLTLMAQLWAACTIPTGGNTKSFM